MPEIQWNFWLALGLFAQCMFFSRFVVQWICSERAGRSVIPTAFWYLSICGASLLLVYSIYRKDPVFILGQSVGFIIYLRNLWLIYAVKRTESSQESVR